MNEKNKPDDCSCSSGCCGNISDPDSGAVNVAKKEIIIDFLYLDLSVCTRCQGAEHSLDEAIKEVGIVLEATGTAVKVNKINVDSAELAVVHKFLSSPTIRVNGQDIQMDYKESLCESCGDLCGEQADCRVWIYQGREYDVPPKAMIIEGILKAVYGGHLDAGTIEPQYVLPQNLRHFYEAMENKK